MIEDKIDALTEAIKENTEELRKFNAGQASAPKTKTAKSKTAKTKQAKPAPAADPEPAAEPEPEVTPTPTPVAAPAADDTPNVPGVQEPGQPEAGEHIDVDEVVGEINGLVKAALVSADDVGAKKKEWAAIRSAYGVERVAELKSNPAALMEVLAKAKAF